MIYQGSKERIAKDILPYIQRCIDENRIETYVEPFVGGANMIDKVKCHYRIGFDKNHYVIELLKYMRDNPDISLAPEDCPFELYVRVRESYNKKDRNFSDEEKAIVGYFASYGGRFFDGGYARDRTGRNMYKERLTKARKQAPLLEKISFVEADYRESVKVFDNPCLVYCDPPYIGTKQYNSVFDYQAFYKWLEEISQDYFVLISEYQMPDNFVCIWKKERKVMQKSDRNNAMTFTEGLWTLRNGKYDNWYINKDKQDSIFDLF